MNRTYILIFLVSALSLSAFADNPALQVLNISGDPFMGFCKVELGDSVLVDTLRFNEGTAFIEVPEGDGQTLRFTALRDTTAVLEINDLNFDADKLYQSILYGVQDDTDYTPNPDGQDLLLNATFVEVDSSGVDENDIRVNFFHGVGDAVEVDVADLIFEFIVDDMAFGQYSSTNTDLPIGLRRLFFTSTDSVVTIASRSIDLTTISSNTITIFLSGFIVPIDNENGPVLGFYSIDQAGTVTELGLVLSTPLDEILDGLKLYPNPTAQKVNLEFYNDRADELQFSLTDLGGKQFVNKRLQVNSGSNNFGLDLPELPNGLYMVRLSNRNGHIAIPLVIFQ